MVIEVMTMYPTPDLPTVLVEHRTRIDAANRRRLAHSSWRRRREARRRLLPSVRWHRPAATPLHPVTPVAAEG